ncbi:hypothetical protein KP004_05790 [Geomonas oryzisoli]|uniref:Uncharacterized protein n=1 Tax=Geomonas oryzisoli TaxID=2847992 RepID=A0ABX8JDD2_9BACT|nr:hypothetical protein [Geomonas oryzisoli]QWV94689.1 hypothetical protein KP004_05790 [Geomonas oryzisoli]
MLSGCGGYASKTRQASKSGYAKTRSIRYEREGKLLSGKTDRVLFAVIAHTFRSSRNRFSVSKWDWVEQKPPPHASEAITKAKAVTQRHEVSAMNAKENFCREKTDRVLFAVIAHTFRSSRNRFSVSKWDWAEQKPPPHASEAITKAKAVTQRHEVSAMNAKENFCREKTDRVLFAVIAHTFHSSRNRFSVSKWDWAEQKPPPHASEAITKAKAVTQRHEVSAMNAKENFCREKTDRVLFAVIAHTFHSSRNRFSVSKWDWAEQKPPPHASEAITKAKAVTQRHEVSAMNAKENFCREKTDRVLFAVIAHTFHSSRNRFSVSKWDWAEQKPPPHASEAITKAKAVTQRHEVSAMNAKENFCREKTDRVLFAVIAHTFHSSRNRFSVSKWDWAEQKPPPHASEAITKAKAVTQRHEVSAMNAKENFCREKPIGFSLRSSRILSVLRVTAFQ